MKKVLSFLLLVGFIVWAGHVNAALYATQEQNISGGGMADTNWGPYAQGLGFLTVNWGTGDANNGLL